jgi:hypothetical protein
MVHVRKLGFERIFAKPSEKFVFIKPTPGKTYAIVEKVIKGSTEHYVEFWDKDGEVVEFEEFKQHLVELVKLSQGEAIDPLPRCLNKN